MHKHINRGFTLIELIFVVAILGLLSTTGILFYQQRMQAQKIEKTVAQMEQWMQAGMAYYVQYGKWPPNATVLMDMGYMPKKSDVSNPWCTAEGSVPCYRVQPIAGGRLFTVTAMINATTAIQEAIASRLPYGVLDKNTVLGTITIPLAGATVDPDVMLMDVVPYHFYGSDLVLQGPDNHVLSTVVTPPEGVALLDEASQPVPPSACVAKYGEQYKFMPYLLNINFDRFANGDERQPVVFSLFNLGIELTGNRLVFRGVFRPQEFKASNLFPVHSAIQEGPGRTFRFRGDVLFVCCRVGSGACPGV